MKIVTWNINGIRSIKSSLKITLGALDADIICLQETKVTRDQLDEPSAILDDYNSYFSFSRARSGYSGVATFVKDSCTPCKAEEGLSGLITPDDDNGIGYYGDQSGFADEELQSLDKEGRTVITQHRIMDSEGQEQLLTIINVYCPRADPENEDRKVFKIRFYQLLQKRAEALVQSGSHVIILGDVNSSHKKIDHCDPAEDEEFNAHPGRKWLNQFLWDKEKDDSPSAQVDMKIDKQNSEPPQIHFIDSFRYFHPNQRNAFTCWNTSTGARATNYGTRIDYIMGNVDLVKNAFSDCIIMPEVEGSDHCPVKAFIDWEILPAKKPPSFCTRYMPEFVGKQQKLSAFFNRKPKGENSSSSELSNSQGSSTSECNSMLSVSQIKEKVPVSVKKEKSPFKRAASEVGKPFPKKRKKEEVRKQGSLLSFFGKNKPESEKNISDMTDIVGCDSHQTNEISGIQHITEETATIYKSNGSDIINEMTSLKPNSQEKIVSVGNVSSTWKSLLKGPPPPPLCKGHQEPCLLRTVKKDSLNKGRQFWVCPRPEGHKSNPEARCEHFVWIDKSKKKS